ncbi:MAG: GGDEF domain-containing protein, partial [Vicinamibacteria bacterium]
MLEEAGQGRLDELVRLLRSGSESNAPTLRLLTELDFEEWEAREHWRRILEHRAELTSKLGREASLQLAAVDYFQNLAPAIRNPKIVEMATFLATERDAITDGLTGLYNRVFFDTSLRRELKRARRYGLAFSLVMIDLDDFKSVNDLYGHVAGDEALAICSDVIRASVREIDVACRYGGEEFAIILPETSRTGAFIVSERIRLDVKERFDHEGPGASQVSMSVSGGIAIYPTDSNSAEGLVRMADKALYRSKHEGKDRITLHAEEKRRSPRLDTRKLLVFRER